MRFPHEVYSEMVASERDNTSRRVAPQSADEKRILSESAIEDDDDGIVDDAGEAGDEELVD